MHDVVRQQIQNWFLSSRTYFVGNGMVPEQDLKQIRME
jgi:hypothetical protein